MIVQIGRYVLNLGALMSIRFHPVQLDPDEREPPKEVATVQLAAGEAIILDEDECVILRGVLEQLRQAAENEARSRVVAVAPRNIRG